MSLNLSKSTILVTGATGSFGRMFIDTLRRDYKPAKVIVFSRDELKQHEMRVAGIDGEDMRYFLGDVRDRNRMMRALHGVDVVVHAAALKQVPACEYNPFEAVQTNIMGAQNIIDAALDNGVSKVVALSTDKAVNPVNLYGATKLVAEKLFIQGNSYSGASKTRFACVRYGNVVGSRGSVIPLFLQQKASGTLTVTDERMTRFWITLQNGVKLVLKALEEMEGGETFVPKIPSMKITDLAKVVAPEAKVKVTGIRPGEKLHEMLISEDEARHTVDAGDHYIIDPENPQWPFPKNRKYTLPDGFRYSSETNKEWATPEQLQKMINA
jgi:UDP-N-acetylglucosamine 4,6-dehydratase